MIWGKHSGYFKRNVLKCGSWATIVGFNWHYLRNVIELVSFKEVLGAKIRT
jgi:hypothetical protein